MCSPSDNACLGGTIILSSSLITSLESRKVCVYIMKHKDVLEKLLKRKKMIETQSDNNKSRISYKKMVESKSDPFLKFCQN